MKFCYRGVHSIPITVRDTPERFSMVLTPLEFKTLEQSPLLERIAIACHKKGWNEGFVAQMLNANDKELTEPERKAVYAKMAEFNNRAIALEAQALVDAGTLASQILAEEAPVEKKPAPKKGK